MFFSIITINRNNAKGLEDTIQSVLSQDRNLYEFITMHRFPKLQHSRHPQCPGRAGGTPEDPGLQ